VNKDRINTSGQPGSEEQSFSGTPADSKAFEEFSAFHEDVALRALPELSVLPFINPEAWAVVTEETPPRLICEVPNQKNALRYARLFSAAPDLYAALDNAMLLLREVWRRDNPNHPIWRNGPAALAKAQGRADDTASPPATSEKPDLAKGLQVEPKKDEPRNTTSRGVQG
jgi:hypothetical protein